MDLKLPTAQLLNLLAVSLFLDEMVYCWDVAEGVKDAFLIPCEHFSLDLLPKLEED